MNHRSALSIFFFVNGLIFASWASRLPRIQEDYYIDHKALGLVLLVHSLGAFVAMPFTGWLISSKGSRLIILVSGVALPIFFMIIPFMPQVAALFLPFLLMGAAGGIMDVSMNAQAVDIERQLEKPIMTMFHALFSIGMVAGGLSGGLFTSYQISITSHFWTIGLISLLMLVFTAKHLYASSEITTEEGGEMFAWPKGPIIVLGLIAFCGMLGEGAMSDWSTSYMKHIVDVSKDYQTLGLTAFASMMTVGRLFGDRGRRIYGDKRMILSGGALSIFGIGLILSLLHPVIVILGFGVVGLGLSNIVPIVYSMAGSFSNIKPGVGIAMATTIGYTGFMFGPPIIGFIADLVNLRFSLGLVGVLFSIMMILVLKSKSST